MTNRRVILYSLIVSTAISLLLATASLKEADSAGLLLPITVIFIIWGIALFIGVLLSVIFKNPNKEPWLYLFGQIFVFGGLMAILGYEWVKDAIHYRHFGNIEHNHYLVELDNKDEAHSLFTKDEGYIKIAFRQFEVAGLQRNDILVCSRQSRNN